VKLIVGLGNPGIRYRLSRHNIGFRITDNLARLFNIRFRKNMLLKASIAKRGDFILAKPNTFMNLSGFSVKRIVDKFYLTFKDLLVICDDMSLSLGKIRLRPKGSSGGHKGLSSVIEALGTQNFPRLRIGIGRPQEGAEASSFVLLRFSGTEEAAIKEAVSKASKCVLDWRKEDIEKVMSKYN